MNNSVSHLQRGDAVRVIQEGGKSRFGAVVAFSECHRYFKVKIRLEGSSRRRVVDVEASEGEPLRSDETNNRATVANNE